MKSFKSNAWLLPQPVLIIGTYDKEGKPNAMNAAWGGQWDMKEIMISLGSHATTIIDFRRKRREVAMPADTADTLASGIGTNDTDLLRQTFWQILEETLAELPREQREAFVETELKGKTNRQLSSETGIPVATLISRKHYAVGHLRHRLADIYKEFKEA